MTRHTELEAFGSLLVLSEIAVFQPLSETGQLPGRRSPLGREISGYTGLGDPFADGAHLLLLRGPLRDGLEPIQNYFDEWRVSGA